MNDFTATNGVVIKAEGRGIGFECTGSGDAHHLGVSETEALHEFARAKADEDLGRWRSAEYDHFVVYPDSVDPDVCVVVNEHGGRSHTFGRDGRLLWAELAGGLFFDVAAAYFAAHPEPKPWREAQPGEGWVIDIGDDEYPNLQAVVVSNEGKFLFRDGHSLARDREYIRSGRRFHPEASE